MGVYLKAVFQAAADHFSLSSSPERQVFAAAKKVGIAREAYGKKGVPFGEFYARLNDALLQQGWPADAAQKGHRQEAVLDGSLSGLVWEISIPLSRMPALTVDTRATLLDRTQGNRRHTKEKTKFVLAHAGDIPKALKSMTDELDRELSRPEGLLLRHCLMKGTRSIFDPPSAP